MASKINDPRAISIAYVSLVVPDTSEFDNPGLHRNGNTFMRNVLIGLKSDSSSEVQSFSAEPMPSFPRGRRLLVRGRQLWLADGITTKTVTFLNITPLKQLHIGLAIAWHLVRWGIRSRRIQHRAVLSYNISVPPLAFTLAAAFLTSAKPLVYITDILVPGETAPGNILYRIDAWLGRQLLTYVKGIIVISDAIARDYLPGRSYMRLDGGVSPEAIEETGRLLAARSHKSEHFTIVVTGSLNLFNGIREVLTAFAQLEGWWYRLIVAGRGPLAVDVEAAKKNDPRIEFRGFLDYGDLLALHAEADALVSMRLTQTLQTSYGFPSKTFEYLLSGVPVITTATGHMREEYGPYCFILDEESPEELATVLRRVEACGREERDRMGRAARRFMIENKSWDVLHKRIAEYVHSTAVASIDAHQAPGYMEMS